MGLPYFNEIQQLNKEKKEDEPGIEEFSHLKKNSKLPKMEM